MKLGEPLLPINPESGYDKQLNRTLLDFFRKLVTQVNGLAVGQFDAVEGIATAAPTTGTYAKGDFLRNSSPSELGSAGSKYVVFGFLCLAGGAPGTWVDVRTLTGN